MDRLIGRYLFDPEMTAEKMIFITGPRQVGKTTFARNWLNDRGFGDMYFNWDDPRVTVEYKKNPMFFENAIAEHFRGERIPIVFDEIHRHREWRKILKGFFDVNRQKMQLMITGSARFSYFQKSGDSLLGRYFSYQMFPIGLPEAIGDFSLVIENGTMFVDGAAFADRARENTPQGANEALSLLLKLGGFPEPFLKNSERFHRRWQKDYKTLLIREDARDLTRISDIKGLETLVELLPTKVGSLFSIPSLCEDLGRKYDTVKTWVDILTGLYLVFPLRAWHKKISRAIKKERKLYFMDWSIVHETGAVFENMIAVSLTRMAARLTETGTGDFEIRYIRDREKREVDFVLIKDNSPLCLFEAKEGGREISRSGRYFAEKLSVPLYQISLNAGKVEAFPGNCFIIPARNFLMLIG
jgi:uncharacterized protein